MARQKTQRSPFEVKLTDDQRNELAYEFTREIDEAEIARAAIVGTNQQLDQWHLLYEGGDGRLTKDTPWPGAANLVSYIGTEKVGAMRARIMSTVFVDPVWTVEGWGAAAARVPFVERFHQWKAEEERLQGHVGKAVHNALVEGTGVLEVAERAEWRRIRARIQAALVVDPMTGLPVMDDFGLPQFQKDDEGKVVEVQDTETPSALTVVDRYVRTRRGPQYRVLSLRDFLILPGHAHDKTEVFAYAKRFYRRMGQLKTLQEQGVYVGVDDLGEDSEREARPDELRAGQTIAEQLGDRVEKELWELAILKDLDGDGIEEWYLATLSRNKRKLLRLQRDDLNLSRFLLITPFPRSNSVYGFSYLGHILGTIIDEHTAIRNAIADRSALVNSAPLKRVIGALWDPYEQPFAPRAVIDVREEKEVTAMQIPDVPGSMVNREQLVLAASERVSGQNDATLGVNPQANRTLGEFNNVVQQSFIRIDEVVRNVQEELEDLWQIRHQIWKRTLREGGEEDIPQGLLAAVEERGFKVPGNKLTADLLEGTFRGKPHGSVETADLNRQRADFIGFLQALAQLVQAVPGLQMLFSQPQAANAILKQAMRVFRWEDRQGLTGVPDEMDPSGMSPAGLPGMMPGMPPGLPAGGMMGALPALLGGMGGGSQPGA
jgi:hypothetical protein